MYMDLTDMISSEMEKTEDTELNNILDEICTDKEKRNIKIVSTFICIRF